MKRGCAKRRDVVGHMSDKEKCTGSGQVCDTKTMAKLKGKMNVEIYNHDVFKIPLSLLFRKHDA
jgi:hypothetical protein